MEYMVVFDDVKVISRILRLNRYGKIRLKKIIVIVDTSTPARINSLVNATNNGNVEIIPKRLLAKVIG